MYDKFAQGTPVCVMIRGSLEYALSDEFVNQIFERTAQRQYTRSLLFSEVVGVMAGVVCQVFPSVNAAYQKQRERFSVGRRALYDKLNNVEPRVTRELVRQTAARMLPVADGLHKRMKKKPLLPGFATRVLDGNHLAATHHRIQELRDVAAGPLPGQVLAVFDPDSCLVVDVFPCEDGHAQERSLLVDVLDSMQPGEAWIADRNFCTSLFLFQTARNSCYFVIRQHARNVRWEAAGQRRKMGRTETGAVYQQRVDLIDDWGNRMRVRRITIKLDRPTGNGDKEIHMLTNLPGRVSAPQIAEVYRNRWKIEGVFSDLAAALNCEISSIGYPPAALFAFGTGLVAYNILSIVRTALAAAHGEDTVEEISAYYVADEIHGMMRGLMVAVSDERWEREFGKLTARQMANRLLMLARQVVIEMFRKHRRGPKKPPLKRTRFRQQTHVSTARILAESRGRKIML
jgi:hypothetical protein